MAREAETTQRASRRSLPSKHNCQNLATICVNTIHVEIRIVLYCNCRVVDPPPTSRGSKKFELELFWWFYYKMAAKLSRKLPKKSKSTRNRRPVITKHDVDYLRLDDLPCLTLSTLQAPTPWST